jgi:hypothetical protein
MKLQDYFPADLTLVGLRNIYSEVGENSFYIQSPCVISKDKIITKGKHYLIFDIPTKTGITITEVILVDLFYYEGKIYLIAGDISTQRVFLISFCLEWHTNDCTMLVVDINYFIDRVNTQAIEDYCSCDNNKQKLIREGKTKIDNDLLEFDF